MVESPWTATSSRYTHENKWFRVRTDEVITPSRQAGEYNVIEVPPAVTVVALDQDNRMCLIREYRYPHQMWMWETPVGSIDEADNDATSAAKRELREETGLTSNDWSFLGVIRGLKGVSNQVLHAFVARNVRAGRVAREGVEAIDEQRFVSFANFFEEVRVGAITDAETISAVTLAYAHLSIVP